MSCTLSIECLRENLGLLPGCCGECKYVHKESMSRPPPPPTILDMSGKLSILPEARPVPCFYSAIHTPQ